MRRIINTAVPVALACLSIACVGQDACVVHEDCVNSQASMEVGRCFPQEFACRSGTCDVRCVPYCEVVDPTVNPCPEGMICNDAPDLTKVGEARCTRIEIPCDTVEQCPYYRPTSDSSAKWSCVEGICRFPGYRYKFEE